MFVGLGDALWCNRDLGSDGAMVVALARLGLGGVLTGFGREVVVTDTSGPGIEAVTFVDRGGPGVESVCVVGGHHLVQMVTLG